jgi:hypothetical protein
METEAKSAPKGCRLEIHHARCPDATCATLSNYRVKWIVHEHEHDHVHDYEYVYDEDWQSTTNTSTPKLTKRPADDNFYSKKPEQLLLWDNPVEALFLPNSQIGF